MSRYENRVQLALALVVGLLLLANLFTLTLVALTPQTRAARAPILFTVFIITLLVSVPCVVLLPRWLLRPYRQLVGEAERAPVAQRPEGARDETEFVLETFQAVVAGSLAGVAIMLWRRERDMQMLLPFGIFLGVGALVSLLVGDAIIGWYVGRFI